MRRILLLTLCLCFGLALIAGCSKSEPEPETIKLPKGRMPKGPMAKK